MIKHLRDNVQIIERTLGKSEIEKFIKNIEEATPTEQKEVIEIAKDVAGPSTSPSPQSKPKPKPTPEQVLIDYENDIKNMTYEQRVKDYERLGRRVATWEKNYKMYMRPENRKHVTKLTKDRDIRGVEFDQKQYFILQKYQKTKSDVMNKAFTDNDLLNRYKKLYENV